jgi:hypothetical protein
VTTSCTGDACQDGCDSTRVDEADANKHCFEMKSTRVRIFDQILNVHHFKNKMEEWDSFFVKGEEDAEHVKDSVDISCFMIQLRCMTPFIHFHACLLL